MQPRQTQQQAMIVPYQFDWVDFGNRLLDSAAFVIASVAILKNEDGCDNLEDLSKSWFFYASFGILLGSALLRGFKHYTKIKDISKHEEEPNISDYFYATVVPITVLILAITGLITTKHPNDNSCFYVQYVSLLGPFSNSVLGDITERQISEYFYPDQPQALVREPAVLPHGIPSSMTSAFGQVFGPTLNAISQPAASNIQDPITGMRGKNQAISIFLLNFPLVQNAINQAVARDASSQAAIERIQTALGNALLDTFLSVQNAVGQEAVIPANQAITGPIQNLLSDIAMQLAAAASQHVNQPVAGNTNLTLSRR